MRNNTKYTTELKEQIISDYDQNKGGYKTLAKRYGLTRDLVRQWILMNRRKIERGLLKITKNDEFKSLEEEVAYLRDAHMFWKTYAELIEDDGQKHKKKAKKSPQSESALKMERKS